MRSEINEAHLGKYCVPHWHRTLKTRIDRKVQQCLWGLAKGGFGGIAGSGEKGTVKRCVQFHFRTVEMPPANSCYSWKGWSSSVQCAFLHGNSKLALEEQPQRRLALKTAAGQEALCELHGKTLSLKTNHLCWPAQQLRSWTHLLHRLET